MKNHRCTHVLTHFLIIEISQIIIWNLISSWYVSLGSTYDIWAHWRTWYQHGWHYSIWQHFRRTQWTSTESLSRSKMVNLKLNKDKWAFGVHELVFLGDVISEEELKPNPVKIVAENWKACFQKNLFWNFMIQKGAENIFRQFQIRPRCSFT